MADTAHPIEGTWLPFRAELSGEAAPAIALAELRLVIRANTYAVHFGREVTDQGHFTINESGALQSIVFVSTRGANAGRTIPSIFQWAGDRLRICYGLRGVSPESFAAPAGSNLYLVSYRRKA